MPILHVRNLNKHFDEFAALSNVSFTLERGEVLAIIGASGSGKTTLLRCLNFLETPDGGSIAVNGQVLFDAAAAARGERQSDAQIRRNRLHFGLVFQQFNLFPQYTALRNVTIGPELLAKDATRRGGQSDKSGKETLREIEAEAVSLLESVGLGDRLSHYPHQLSGGQQQRVAIARALALKPDILCFDEPTSALDPELTGEVLKVIKALAERDTTMVIVTHEMAFAAEVADRVIFMDGGKILADGAPRDILENPDSPRIQAFLRKIRSEGEADGGGIPARLDRVVVADPAGNITALVFDDLRHLDAAARAELNDAIIAAALRDVPGAPAVEQCGFVTGGAGSAGAAGGVDGAGSAGATGGALEMFGGEFCGNATRSVRHLLGAKNPVTVDMPLPAGGVRVREADGGGSWLVPFDGITHLVVTDAGQLANGSVRDTMLAILAENKYGFRDLPAVGVSYFDEGTGRAAFSLRVRDMDTIFSENSCGSGTAAIAAALAHRDGEDKALRVIQPSGDALDAAAIYDRGASGGGAGDAGTGRVTGVTTTGTVRILYDGPLTL
jgi:polar amino acid transport system ATP-binding protein